MFGNSIKINTKHIFLIIIFLFAKILQINNFCIIILLLISHIMASPHTQILTQQLAKDYNIYIIYLCENKNNYINFINPDNQI